MNITKAIFKCSSERISQVPKDALCDIAFIGRSNVGKSSLINCLTAQKNLAKTSSTPGLTKMINYFVVNELFRIVDLPGYGYAKTGHKHIANWSGLMEKYLTCSPNLKTVFVLVDCRHEPSELDKMMLEFLNSYQIPYLIVATKVDKLAKSKIPQACAMIAKTLGVRKELVQGFSSENRFGREKLLEYIENLI